MLMLMGDLYTEFVVKQETTGQPCPIAAEQPLPY